MWLHAMTEEIRGYQIGTLQRPAQGQSCYATEWGLSLNSIQSINIFFYLAYKKKKTYIVVLIE